MKHEAKMKKIDDRLMGFVSDHIHDDGQCDDAPRHQVDGKGRLKTQLVYSGWGGTYDGRHVGEDGIVLETDDGVRIIVRVEDVIQPDEW
jgi:hypothetical protein